MNKAGAALFGLLNGYWWLSGSNSLWWLNAIVCLICVVVLIAPAQPKKKPQ